MQAPRKAAVRFKERSELLDFLLEVSAATAQTLDLDQLVRDAVLLDLPLVPTCESLGLSDCAPAIPLADAPEPDVTDDAPADPRWAALSELEL